MILLSGRKKYCKFAISYILLNILLPICFVYGGSLGGVKVFGFYLNVTLGIFGYIFAKRATVSDFLCH